MQEFAERAHDEPRTELAAEAGRSTGTQAHPGPASDGASAPAAVIQRKYDPLSALGIAGLNQQQLEQRLKANEDEFVRVRDGGSKKQLESLRQENLALKSAYMTGRKRKREAFRYTPLNRLQITELSQEQLEQRLKANESEFLRVRDRGSKKQLEGLQEEHRNVQAAHTARRKRAEREAARDDLASRIQSNQAAASDLRETIAHRKSVLHEAKEYGMPVPAELKRKYRAEIAEFEAERTRLLEENDAMGLELQGMSAAEGRTKVGKEGIPIAGFTPPKLHEAMLAAGVSRELLERPLTDFEVLLKTEGEIQPLSATGTTQPRKSKEIAPMLDEGGQTIAYVYSRGGYTELYDVNGRLIDIDELGVTPSEIQPTDFVPVGALAAAPRLAMRAGSFVLRTGTKAAKALGKRLRMVTVAAMIGGKRAAPAALGEATSAAMTTEGRVAAALAVRQGTTTAAQGTTAAAQGTTAAVQGTSTAATVRYVSAAESQTLVGTSTRQMRRVAARTIASQENHPLKFLLNALGKFRSSKGLKHSKLIDNPDILEMGHITSNKAGAQQRIMLQSAWDNQFSRITIEKPFLGAYTENVAIDIGGIAVDLNTALWWEELGLLAAGTVAQAPRLVF